MSNLPKITVEIIFQYKALSKIMWMFDNWRPLVLVVSTIIFHHLLFCHAVEIHSLYVAGSEGKECLLLRPIASNHMMNNSQCSATNGYDDHFCGAPQNQSLPNIRSDICSLNQKLSAAMPSFNASLGAQFIPDPYQAINDARITSICSTDTITLVTFSDGSLYGAGSAVWLNANVSLGGKTCSIQCAEADCSVPIPAADNNRSGFIKINLRGSGVSSAFAVKARCAASAAVVLLGNGSVVSLGLDEQADGISVLGLPNMHGAPSLLLNITTAIDVDIVFEAIFVVLRNGTVLMRSNQSAAAIFGGVPTVQTQPDGPYHGGVTSPAVGSGTISFRIVAATLQYPINSITASSAYILLRSADNTMLYGLGYNAQGTLGAGYPSIKSNLEMVWQGTDSGSSITSFSAGVQHALILLSNGTVLGRGSNAFGQLYTNGEKGTGGWVTLDDVFHRNANLSNVSSCKTVHIAAGNGNSFAIVECSYSPSTAPNSTLVVLGSNTACAAGVPKAINEVREGAQIIATSLTNVDSFVSVHPTPSRHLYVVTRKQFDDSTTTSTTTTTLPTTTSTTTTTTTSVDTTTTSTSPTTTSTSLTSTYITTSTVPTSTTTNLPQPLPTLPPASQITAAYVRLDRARVIIDYGMLPTPSSVWVRCKEIRGNLTLLPTPSDFGTSNLCAGRWIHNGQNNRTYLVVSLGGDAVLPSGSLSLVVGGNTRAAVSVSVTKVADDPSGLVNTLYEYGIIVDRAQASHSIARDMRTSTYHVPAWGILLIVLGCVILIFLLSAATWVCCSKWLERNDFLYNAVGRFRRASIEHPKVIPVETDPSRHPTPSPPQAGQVFDATVLPTALRPKGKIATLPVQASRSVCYEYVTNNPIDYRVERPTQYPAHPQKAYRFADRTTPRVLKQSDFGPNAPLGTYDQYLQTANFYDNLSTNAIESAAGPDGELTYHPRVRLVEPEREIPSQRFVADQSLVRYSHDTMATENSGLWPMPSH